MGAISKGWFLHTGSSGDDPIPFGAQSTEVRHYPRPGHHLRHNIRPVCIPAKLALNSEQREQLNHKAQGC